MGGQQRRRRGRGELRAAGGLGEKPSLIERGRGPPRSGGRVRGFTVGRKGDCGPLAPAAGPEHTRQVAPGQISKLNEIPYLDHSQLTANRFLACLTFYVDGEWRFWTSTEDPNEFVELYAWPAEAYYFAQQAENEGDFSTRFLSFVAQHANLGALGHTFQAFQDDLFNLSASLHKLSLIHASTSEGRTRLASTEVEYVLLVCRSMFDLLQEMLRTLWDSISLTDASVKKRQLKKTFSDMALRGDSMRTAPELQAAFGLPETWATCYVRHAPIFLKIRKFRDDLVHRGHRVSTIFNGDTEFLITRRLGPFRDLEIWREEEKQANELGPLMPALGLMIHGVLAACDDFAEVLGNTVRWPGAMAPGMWYMCRGYFNQGLIDALNDAESRIREGRFLLGRDAGTLSLSSDTNASSADDIPRSDRV